MKKIKKENQIIIYQTSIGSLEIKADLKEKTIWASQYQIADIFGIERSVVTKHINNILSDRELDKKSVCAKFAQTASDGKSYKINHYNLDVVLAVGYRTNSNKAIKFRRWATTVLRSYITEGFVINKNQIEKNYNHFLEVVNNFKMLSKNKNIESDNILDLVKMFASTWLSLDAYDKDKLNNKGYAKKKVSLTAKKLSDNLEILKKELIFKKEASDLFARESKSGNLSAIIGNVMQSFGGKDLYGTIEEKAANLFYLIIKNHPFIDGNKRSGAYSFIWFLNKAKVLNINKITPPALTALTILIAESNPKEKEKMVSLILTILGKKD